jgi:hypothetical protein
MATFTEQNSNTHPVTNWMAIITALTTNMPAANVPLPQLEESILDVFRMVWIVIALNAQSTTLVSNAQVAAVLAAFDAAYGTAAGTLTAAAALVRSSQVSQWQANTLKTANTAFIAALS